jgi:hypothetical protein
MIFENDEGMLCSEEGFSTSSVNFFGFSMVGRTCDANIFRAGE